MTVLFVCAKRGWTCPTLKLRTVLEQKRATSCNWSQSPYTQTTNLELLRAKTIYYPTL